jgi:hypothetical protein
MPVTYTDEPQTLAFLSCWIGHNRQELRMAETLPDEEDDELEDDELEDDELEDEDDDEDEES